MNIYYLLFAVERRSNWILTTHPFLYIEILWPSYYGTKCMVHGAWYKVDTFPKAFSSSSSWFPVAGPASVVTWIGVSSSAKPSFSASSSPHSFSPPGLEGLRRQYLIKGESLYSIISQIGAREILWGDQIKSCVVIALQTVSSDSVMEAVWRLW